jgi:predicted phosphodiesterase
MRILLISDIHGNLMALESVLESSGGFEEVWCLGDIVGYGPNPNECIKLIRKLPNLNCIIGNHDAAAINTLSSDSFNPSARSSSKWTKDRLTDESREFLRGLPDKIESDNELLVHGSPYDHVMEYLLDIESAERAFSLFKGDFCFVGHSHLPMYFRKYSDGSIEQKIIVDDTKEVRLEHRMICNPGSVGQPRDRNPKASFAIIDSEDMTITYQRAKYDVKKTQGRMLHHNLPQRHITRLENGW